MNSQCDDEKQKKTHILCDHLCDTVSRCRTYVISSTNTDTHTHITGATPQHITIRAVLPVSMSSNERSVSRTYTRFMRVWDGNRLLCASSKVHRKSLHQTDKTNLFEYVHRNMKRSIWNETDEKDETYNKNANKRKRSQFGNRFLVVKMTFWYQSICQIYSNNWQHVFLYLAIEYWNCVVLVPSEYVG